MAALRGKICTDQCRQSKGGTPAENACTLVFCLSHNSRAGKAVSIMGWLSIVGEGGNTIAFSLLLSPSNGVASSERISGMAQSAGGHAVREVTGEAIGDHSNRGDWGGELREDRGTGLDADVVGSGRGARMVTAVGATDGRRATETD